MIPLYKYENRGSETSSDLAESESESAAPWTFVFNSESPLLHCAEFAGVATSSRATMEQSDIREAWAGQQRCSRGQEGPWG